MITQTIPTGMGIRNPAQKCLKRWLNDADEKKKWIIDSLNVIAE